MNIDGRVYRTDFESAYPNGLLGEEGCPLIHSERWGSLEQNEHKFRCTSSFKTVTLPTREMRPKECQILPSRLASFLQSTRCGQKSSSSA